MRAWVRFRGGETEKRERRGQEVEEDGSHLGKGGQKEVNERGFTKR
jgi:hypothetical protein